VLYARAMLHALTVRYRAPHKYCLTLNYVTMKKVTDDDQDAGGLDIEMDPQSYLTPAPVEYLEVKIPTFHGFMQHLTMFSAVPEEALGAADNEKALEMHRNTKKLISFIGNSSLTDQEENIVQALTSDIYNQYCLQTIKDANTRAQMQNMLP